jgi:hypothetical protein
MAAAAVAVALAMHGSRQLVCLQGRAVAVVPAAPCRLGLQPAGTLMLTVNHPCQHRSTATPARRASRWGIMPKYTQQRGAPVITTAVTWSLSRSRADLHMRQISTAGVE